MKITKGDSSKVKVCFLTPNSAPYWDDTIYKFNSLYRDVQIDFLICNDSLSRHPEWNYENKNENKIYLSKKIKIPFGDSYSTEILSKLKTYDVIIIGGYFPVTCLVGLIYCLFKKKKFIFASDCVDYGHNFSLFKNILFKEIVKCAMGFWVPGNASKDFFLKLGVNKNKIITGLYAYNVEKVYEIYTRSMENEKELRKRYGIDEDDFVFMFIGKLTKRRNIKGILEAFEKVVLKVSNVKLFIVGEGEDEDIISGYTNTLKSNLIYKKAVNFHESHELYAICDTYIHAGDEQYSLTVLEAYILGITCIISNKVGCGFDMKKRDNLFVFEIDGQKSLEDVMVYVSEMSNKIKYQPVKELWNLDLIAEELYRLIMNK